MHAGPLNVPAGPLQVPAGPLEVNQDPQKKLNHEQMQILNQVYLYLPPKILIRLRITFKLGLFS